MKLRMDPVGYIFAAVFAWMFTQFWCQPEEPPEPIIITAPALNTNPGENQ